MPQTHRWSGWPGAWCLDCGTEDPLEIALADGSRIGIFGEEEADLPPELIFCPVATLEFLDGTGI